jgi:Do/DeqQ family serine protease
MNIFSRRALVSALWLALTPILLAADEKKSALPSKKPALRVDNTPVTDVRPGVVSTYADVLEPVQKAVVSIYSTKIVKERIRINPFFRQFFPELQDQERESEEQGLGSGVLVSADGYILTNNHVVEGADKLKVTLADDRDFIGKVIGADPKTDIAVVKIEPEKEQLPFVTLADSGKLRVGDLVFAVGNPLGIGETVTMGIVSAKGRRLGILQASSGYEDYIQTDAAINMGNSGGALVDAKGRLVGINSAIYSPTRTNIGIGFAVPVNLAATVMNSLIETGTVARGWLGVEVDNLTPDLAEQLELPKDAKGVVINEVDAHSAAEKAGLKPLDAILAVNDKPVTSREELRFTVAQMTPGSRVKLRLVRDGKERTIEMTVDKLVDNPNELLAGVEVAPLTPQMRRRLRLDPRGSGGLEITKVADDSPFREQLAPHMVIIEINRTPVSDLASAREALHLQANKALLEVFDGVQVKFLVVQTH